MESYQSIQLNIQTMRFVYDDSEEDVPPNFPEPQFHPVQMNVFVGSDHSIDRIIRRL